MAQHSMLQARRACDHERRETFTRIAIPSTPENRDRIQAIFAFQSSLLQNIAGITPGHFQFSVLSEPFSPSHPNALDRLAPPEAVSALRQYMTFLGAAREWRLDFVDFTHFQVLPDGRLRFAWKLETQAFPSPTEFIPLFAGCRHLRGLDAKNYRDFCRRSDSAVPPAESAAYLCRREDFASNLLHFRLPKGASPRVNMKVRIRTRRPWQKAVACRNLLHNLHDERTLLLEADLKSATLGEYLAVLCGRRPAAAEDLHSQAQQLRLFLTQSVFQEAILILDHLQRREDDRLLRFLLESGEISGLSAILLDDSAPGECDLEFYESPLNLLQPHFPAPPPEVTPLDVREEELRQRLFLLGVAVPRSVAERLASYRDGAAELPSVPQGDGAAKLPPARTEGNALLAGLIEKGSLIENREQGTLMVAGSAERELSAADGPARNRLLGWLAGQCAWPYAQIAHLAASGRTAELGDYLGRQAQESAAAADPPSAELLGRLMPGMPAGSPVLELGLDILIRGNHLALAVRIINGLRGRLPAALLLKSAHLALRRKDYKELGRLLALHEHRPEPRLRDEWLYVNYAYNEKAAQKSRAREYARKIRSPYYRHLALIQLSDRAIYQRDFAAARKQLTAALAYFSTTGRPRETIEARMQMAKLLREEGDSQGSETLYKTIYAEGEAEGLALNAAAAAVDLGNLYLENDDDFQAECWYQKAGRLFAREKNDDGLMLVNANMVNVLIAKGEWLEADRLLAAILSWDEEKQLPDSCAIDLLNRSTLEALRRHDEKALELAARAEVLFRNSANRKGLGECAFLRARVQCLAGATAKDMPGNCTWLSEDQRIACGLLARPGPQTRPGEHPWEKGLFRTLAAIRSRKIRFEALRLLLKKHRRSEWLGYFQEMALELSPRAKNYFFYEYWYMVFELAPEAPPGARRGEFIAMFDFFTVNGRSMPAKLVRLNQQCAEGEGNRGLFEDARLVEHSRHWRLPADFFRSFVREISRTAPNDWLLMAIHETRPPRAGSGERLFRFASSAAFGELGEEMLQDALAAPRDQNTIELAEVRRRFRSQERFVYPFASTKLIRWPLTETILACLVIAFQDNSLLFQDFAGRHRDTFKAFSLLFQNFMQNEYRVQEKLDFIVGASEKIRELKLLIAQVSKVDFSLLVTGESGCGKELVANAVHRLSPRATHPFISLNAAAIPDTLLEAELFGFRKGAFSGASEDRVGLLQAADRGTLFLDEIADLPLPLQAKLLRALQEREFRRLGENRTIQVDVRLISASNRDLGELIRNNMFRADLFYRLQDLQIHIPPLRERREDIPLLIGSFLEKFGYPRQEPARLQAIADLYRDDEFPGNVRELESKIKNLITFHPELELPPAAATPAFGLRHARREFEMRFLRRILSEAGWRRSLAAERLGISRMALFNLLKKYGISE